MEAIIKKLFGLDEIEAQLDEISAYLESAEVGEAVAELYCDIAEQAAGPMGRWLFK